MIKKLVIINGTMGVGKTTICKNLYKSLSNSAWLDGDWCWTMNPFIANEENRQMVIENISFMLNNFLKNSLLDYVIFNWLIDSDDIMNLILDKLEKLDVTLYKITLTCSKDEIIKRVGKDILCGIRDKASINRSLERLELYSTMDTIKVDTTGKEVIQIIDEVKSIICI